MLNYFIFEAWETFLSDVGGASGLVLGMSVSTIFGLIDFIICLLISGLKSIKDKILKGYFIRSF